MSRPFFILKHRQKPSNFLLHSPSNDLHIYIIMIFFLGLIISKIFGSNTPSTPIKSSGRELVIKFKSQIKNGPFYLKNIQAKFLLSYVSEYNGNIHYNTQ